MSRPNGRELLVNTHSRVGVDPLQVAGGRRKGIDAILSNLQPGTAVNFTADPWLVKCCQFFGHGHVPLAPLFEKMIAKRSNAMLSQI